MTVLETVVIPFNYSPIIMEEGGFEPPNPKERFYRPSRLATSLLLHKSLIVIEKQSVTINNKYDN